MQNFKWSMRRRYGEKVSIGIEEYVKANKKIVRAQEAVEYNRTCINNGIKPKYIKLKAVSCSMKNSLKILDALEWRAAEIELQSKEHIVVELTNGADKIKNKK